MQLSTAERNKSRSSLLTFTEIGRDQRKDVNMDNLTDKEFLAVWSLMGRARVQARQREYAQAHPIRVAVERFIVPFQQRHQGVTRR